MHDMTTRTAGELENACAARYTVTLHALVNEPSFFCVRLRAVEDIIQLGMRADVRAHGASESESATAATTSLILSSVNVWLDGKYSPDRQSRSATGVGTTRKSGMV